MDHEGDNAIFEEESIYIEIKTEVEDFLKSLNEPYLDEFRSQFNVIFQQYQSSFSEVSITRRQLNEVHEKLKRSLKNKEEMIKNIEENTERYNSLKNEFESYYFRIDEKKIEEQEKEKQRKALDEEIVNLNARNEQENYQFYQPQELEMKAKLILQREEISNEVRALEFSKEQTILLENKLIEEKIASEKIQESLEKEYKNLEEEYKRLEAEARNEEKKKNDLVNNLNHIRELSTILKREVSDLEEIIASSATDQSRLKNYLETIESEKKHKEESINSLKKKIEMTKKIYEENRVKKLLVIEDTIKTLKATISKKEKDKLDIVKEANKFLQMADENQSKIDNIRNQLKELEKKKHLIEADIEQVEAEIKLKKAEFAQKKTSLTQDVKLNDQKKRELEKLANEISELDKEKISLKNANHRAVNETYGIKREILESELNRDNIEKEKNLYAKQASDANMEHTQSLEKLKNLNEAISELKEKNLQAETKLKQQKKIYEALKADSNRFEKKHQEAQREIKDILEEKLKKEGKYNSLKIELDYKQGVVKDTETKLEGFQEAVDKSEKEVKDLEVSCNSYKESIEKYIENNTNLKKLTSSAESDYQNQKKEYAIVVREKDFLQSQLIQRNKEITELYEKIKVLQQELFKMHRQYENKILEIEKLKSTRDFLLDEYTKTEDIIRNVFDLKVVKIKLEKEVLTAKNKLRALEDQTKKPLNIHRWTKLEYSDPEKYELITQINSLQRRLIAKSEEVNQKEDLIQEKEKLYIKLKTIVARQSGIEMEEPLTKFKGKIKEETERLKALKDEIKNYRMDIKNYEYEIRRIDQEIEKIKSEWFAMMRQANQERESMIVSGDQVGTNFDEEDEYPREDNQKVEETNEEIRNENADILAEMDNINNFAEYFKNKVNSV
jgi:chromosome segregation ATPase